MTAIPSFKVWRVVAADVLAGVRHVSHNTLALLGLVAVVAVVFLSERADMRHQAEEKALGWLIERASSRTAVADVAEPNDVLLAMAEPEAIARATAMDPADLNRQQAAVVGWISRRYNVAPEPIGRLVQEAWAVGKKAGVEPTLILAVMAIESGFNPFAQSHVGAQGLMQVMTGVHRDKYEIFGGRRAAFDPVTNLRVGAQVLKDCIARAGSPQEGLKYYVGAANLTDDGGYATKVLAEQSYLRDVVAGHKVASNAPLPQPGSNSAEAEATTAPQAAIAPALAASATATQGATPASPAASEAPLLRRAEQVALAH
jgi:hypothetical protein